MKKILHLFIFGTLLLLFQANVANAAISIDNGLRPEYAAESYCEKNECSTDSAENFDVTSVNYIIADMAAVLLQITGSLTVFFIILNGFNLIKGMGNEEEITKAKKGLTWAFIGLFVVILSYAMVQNVFRISLEVDEASTTTEATE
jgi:hypothetical protein